MSNFYLTRKKLRHFTQLPAGWHYGEGGPITDQSLGLALAILDKLALMGFDETDAFPGENGDVQVVAYDRPELYEFNVELNGTVTIAHDHDRENVFYEEQLSLSAALDQIERFAFEKCDYSDSSTLSISTLPVAGFQAWLLRTPQTAAEYQYSISNAPKIKQEKYVLMLPSITLRT